MGEPIKLEAVAVEIGGGWFAAIGWGYSKKVKDLQKLVSPEDPSNKKGDGVWGVDATSGDAPILLDLAEDRKWGRWLILQETQPYDWEIWCTPAKQTEVLSPLSGKKGWRENKIADRCSGSFQIVNYCGRATLAPKAASGFSLRFEIEPKKFSEKEYRTLSETLEKEVAQLLVDWETPTALWRSAGGDSDAILAEKFAFLSTGVGAEKMREALDQICTNPHRQLETETRWMPAGVAHPGLFAGDPLRHGHDWSRVAGKLFPSEIEEERKYDTFDTGPNRFIQFALGDFLTVCNLAHAHAGEGSFMQFEAGKLAEWIEEAQDDPFFVDVGEMVQMPFNNPTLQDREGYSQILSWWLQMSLAGRVEWKGRDDLYQAPDRSLDKLYEYWLYLELRRMLVAPESEGGLGMEEIAIKGNDQGIRSLVSEKRKDDGSEVLSIRLKQGKETVSCFRWHPSKKDYGDEANDVWRIHLYYNRTFSLSEDPRQRGSYSSSFRPDYTIMAFPEKTVGKGDEKITTAEVLNQEAEAEEENSVTYWHFDAKYRFDEIFQKSFGLSEDKAEGVSESEIESEMKEIKAEGKFKRADLFKMHAYNDAIRRTAGSYVLYPGDKNKTFKKFHEIIPGVGAFHVKPDASDPQRPSQEIAKFLKEAIYLRRKPGSNLNVLREAEYDTAHGVEFSGLESPLALIGGYKSKAIATLCMKIGIFYWRVKNANGKSTVIDPRAKDAKWVIPYTTGEWCGVRMEVESVETMSAANLAKKINDARGKTPFPRDMLSSGSSEYAVMSVKIPAPPSDKVDVVKLDKATLSGHPDSTLLLSDFILKGHRPLCLPYASLFS